MAVKAIEQLAKAAVKRKVKPRIKLKVKAKQRSKKKEDTPGVVVGKPKVMSPARRAERNPKKRVGRKKSSPMAKSAPELKQARLEAPKKDMVKGTAIAKKKTKNSRLDVAKMALARNKTKIAAGVLAGGLGATALSNKKRMEQRRKTAGETAPKSTPSESKTKETFSAAFKANRAAGKKEFTYGGKKYHTKTKEEMAKKATPKKKKVVPAKSEREKVLAAGGRLAYAVKTGPKNSNRVSKDTIKKVKKGISNY